MIMVCHLTHIDEGVLSVYVHKAIWRTRVNTTAGPSPNGSSLLMKEEASLIARILEGASFITVVFLHHFDVDVDVGLVGVRREWQDLRLFGKARSWIEWPDVEGGSHFFPYHIWRLRVLDAVLVYLHLHFGTLETSKLDIRRGSLWVSLM